MTRVLIVLAALAVTAALPPIAHAVPPTPLSGGFFGFPAFNPSPGAATSTGLALADRWIGDEPFDNPASGDSAAIALTPMMLRVSRQDLRAGNRNYDETAAFFDVAGGWIRGPLAGPLHATLYASQPERRQEENAFTQGEAGGPVAPATIRTQTDAREARAGLALAWVTPTFAIGVAPEVTTRDDEYTLVETSGNPFAGTTTLKWSGDAAFGGQAGLRWAMPVDRLWGFTVGAGARYLPPLELDATHTEDLVTTSGETSFAIERESGWEGGVSVAVQVNPTFRAFGGAGGRTRQAWTGLDLTAGRSTEWSVGGAFHDERDPWTFRFGLGGETHEGTPEPKAGRIALGLGWSFGDVGLEFGAMRRMIHRPDEPTSFDDRVLATVVVEL